MEKQEQQKRRKLIEPVDTGQKVLLIAEHLRKKDAPGVLYNGSTQNKSFFNRNEIFIVNRRVGINNGKTDYYYWVEKDDKNIKDRFRQGLFTLKGQNKKWMFHIFILTS